jgi:pimeloyl-ACP methyl ester carboxylesterase
MIATQEHQSFESHLGAELQHVDVNGAHLAYVEKGQGEPVVFVHGGISDLSIWGPLLEPVSHRYRAIAYSRRYAWPNQPIPEGVPDTIAPHAADLAQLIENLHLGAAHVVGNSWGAFVALVVARDRL